MLHFHGGGAQHSILMVESIRLSQRCAEAKTIIKDQTRFRSGSEVSLLE